MKLLKTFWVVCVIFFSTTAFSYQLAAMSLEKMSAGAGEIFYGVVTKVETSPNFVYKNSIPYIQVTFDIKETLKGTSSKQKVIKIAGIKNSKGEVVPLAGNPTHYVGQELVSFYTKPHPSSGFSSPIGFQGLFGIKTTSTGHASVFNLVLKDAYLHNLQNPNVISYMQSSAMDRSQISDGIISYKDLKHIVGLSQ
ncbi:MAG: hypothetical protein R3A11_01910 [Bdellovibrionota bacterium]